MHNTTFHTDQTPQAADQLDVAATTAQTNSRPPLAPLPVAVRAAALVLAVITTGMLLGSQLGLSLMYESQVEDTLARSQPAQSAGQLVASAN